MTAAPWRTGTGQVLHVETQQTLPGLAGLYARGAAASGRIAAGRALPSLPGLGSGSQDPDRPLVLPTVALRVSGVTTSELRGHLRDYQRLLHEPVSDVLPAGYLHVLAFPLATAVMVRGDFPLPLLGMVHLANHVEMRGPVRVGDVLEVRAWAENLRPHRRGVQVDLVAEIWPDGDDSGLPRWRGVSTYLAKGFTAPEPDVVLPAVPVDPAPRGRTAGRDVVPPEHDLATGATTSPTDAWVPPLPTGRWALGPGTGRAYAAVSGDRNPIHLSSLSAKAFGFPRAIAHGMYTASRALADVGHARGDAYRWTVEFAQPVLLPGTVDVAVTPELCDTPDGFGYVGWNARRGRRHFQGEVTPL
ncbi:MaoC dehydratase-like protein [Isoptericola jiangsuensis]|uniref:MaoC dehydratase-like protein n=1 Tax=Isoptericola jiangsuensis TaxID=548579 RepID=A0A2A9ETF9_9MICO|nr:MaoC/PaaZ C-terminal domain-containing protein [Isoptericola jiangsuensis]PFG41821.1 MaoC dehydratase-like protein [Isoptericola jiangsuensis]